MTTLAAPPVAPAGSHVTYRRYHGLEDIPGMGAAIQALRTHGGILEPIDVAAMEHRYTHLVNSVPQADCVIAEIDGRVAGYVRVEWHDLTDGDRACESTAVVAPWAWGHGIGDAWLDWAEARLGDPSGPPPPGLARAAITESLRRLRDGGATAAYLGVDTANHNRALALYESCGFHVVSGGADYRKPFRGPEDVR